MYIDSDRTSNSALSSDIASSLPNRKRKLIHGTKLPHNIFSRSSRWPTNYEYQILTRLLHASSSKHRSSRFAGELLFSAFGAPIAFTVRYAGKICDSRMTVNRLDSVHAQSPRSSRVRRKFRRFEAATFSNGWPALVRATPFAVTYVRARVSCT